MKHPYPHDDVPQKLRQAYAQGVTTTGLLADPDPGLRLVGETARICLEYDRQGYRLTLRQLYYQFVARGLLPNSDGSYKVVKRLALIGRYAGYVDWDHIEDRTRQVEALSHFAGPAALLREAATQYQDDLWAGQAAHVEVWIEKDALLGLIEGPCADNDVAYFSCRGYTSATTIRDTALRLLRAHQQQKQRLVVLHFGDHDPSGWDMSRDVEERIRAMVRTHNPQADAKLEVKRVALLRAQINAYSPPPPPMPAKVDDSRYKGYVRDHGPDAWELDALQPADLVALVEDAIEAERDAGLWAEAVEQRDADRQRLNDLADDL